MRRAYKFRLYPTPPQVAAMDATLETHRRLYNNALAERKEAWEAEKRSVTYAQQNKVLTAARKTDPFLAAANNNSCQRTLRRLDRAFQAFFRRVKAGEAKAGYPQFVRYGEFRTVEFTYNGAGSNGFRLFNGAGIERYAHVRIQYVPGLVRVRYDRPVQGLIKTACVTREADGWYAVFACDLGAVEAPPSQLPPVAVDMGLDLILATSDGDLYPAPRYYGRAEQRLKRAQRRLARRQKGGKRREKARALLARIHQHIGNQRRDWQHKTARALLAHYGTIVHDDVRAGRVARVRGDVAKAEHDAGWGQFLTILANKSRETGATVLLTEGRDLPEPGAVCPRCGRQVPPPEGLTVVWRVRRCPQCGTAVYPTPTAERARAVLESAAVGARKA